VRFMSSNKKTDSPMYVIKKKEKRKKETEARL